MLGVYWVLYTAGTCSVRVCTRFCVLQGHVLCWACTGFCILQGHVLCGCVLGSVCCRDMFCAGRVPEEDLKRTLQACGGCIQSTVASLEKDDTVLGTCALFEEKQVGGDRYVMSLSTCKVRDVLAVNMCRLQCSQSVFRI